MIEYTPTLISPSGINALGIAALIAALLIASHQRLARANERSIASGPPTAATLIQVQILIVCPLYPMGNHCPDAQVSVRRGWQDGVGDPQLVDGRYMLLDEVKEQHGDGPGYYLVDKE
jgi:hypothetical protein